MCAKDIESIFEYIVNNHQSECVCYYTKRRHICTAYRQPEEVSNHNYYTLQCVRLIFFKLRYIIFLMQCKIMRYDSRISRIFFPGLDFVCYPT